MWEEHFYQLSITAARQNGLITAAQAKRAGVDDVMLGRFTEFGLIRELDWSVYQISGSSYGPRFAYPYAAWLAISPETYRWERSANLHEDAVLSHESACALMGLGAVKSTGVRFTAPVERTAPRAVRITVAPLTPDEVGIHEGVPVTTPHRIILDLVAEWTARDDISRVFSDAVRRDLVNLRTLFEDLAYIADEYGLPTGGVHFVDYFMPDLRPESLSPRNLRTYAELMYPEKIAEVRPQVDQILLELRDGSPDSAAPGNQRISADIAAEIIGRARGAHRH
ncbi:type IV toxin-antitoxin system AbiEi family antitoxin domain-containing protein [Nocardia australiensis]|uniref:type IV toxin-antitoxin system AbiEi family antitoxin domain-containing protein n=1 Tax=Nocardia australiensis TaxID=2887191 RepID=UPI001D140B33|nr:type IV toxin-antitoxin system AbiEi family antitoxin domain-containing protein [Nocardia australiensis]